MKNTLILLFVIFGYLFSQNSNSGNNSDPLSETPLFPIPPEMTFEEYKDMNRRLSQAFLWSSIPVPGITHYYAGEKKKAKRLFYIGLGGVACVFGGIISMDEPTWPIEDENIHVVHNRGTENERWFERIPVRMEGDAIIHYELKEIQKQQNGDGGGLIILGLAILAGDFIYDRIKGLQLLEEKRDRVRFKYGQQLKFSYQPTIDYSTGNPRLGLNFYFNLFNG